MNYYRLIVALSFIQMQVVDRSILLPPRIKYDELEWGWASKCEPLLQNVRGRPAAYLCCKRCGGFASYHEYPPTGLFVDACWTCKRTDDVGTCWCGFCQDRVGALCNTCGNKGPAQCDCPVEVGDSPKKKGKEGETMRTPPNSPEHKEHEGPTEPLPRPPLPIDGKEDTGKKEFNLVSGPFGSRAIMFVPGSDDESIQSVLKELGPEWKCRQLTVSGGDVVKDVLHTPNERPVELAIKKPTMEKQKKRKGTEKDGDNKKKVKAALHAKGLQIGSLNVIGDLSTLSKKASSALNKKLEKLIEDKKQGMVIVYGPDNFFFTDEPGEIIVVE